MMEPETSNACMEYIGRAGRMKNSTSLAAWGESLAARYPVREWRKMASAKGLDASRMTAAEALEALLAKFMRSRTPALRKFMEGHSASAASA